MYNLLRPRFISSNSFWKSIPYVEMTRHLDTRAEYEYARVSYFGQCGLISMHGIESLRVYFIG